MTTPDPTPAQQLEIRLWLHDPHDTRTVDQLRADLRAMGDGVHPVGVRVVAS